MRARALLEASGCGPEGEPELLDDKAARFKVTGKPGAAREALSEMLDRYDVIALDEAGLSPSLLISDMDSTMIVNECIDELADYAGIKDRIAAVTERAMRGELDFEAALRERVALLEGLSEHAIADCLAHRIRPMPGAKTLIATLSERGTDCILVSGGFHDFADAIGAELGFDAVYANRLVIEHGHLTGGLGDGIVDAARKREILESEIERQGLDRAATIALGDGANDIPMIEGAGLGLAFRAKPAAKAAASAHVDHGDHTALLYALGIPSAEWRD